MNQQAKLGGGVLIVVLLNYVFNELMDDSGLPVFMLTGRVKHATCSPVGVGSCSPDGYNATARSAFRARCEFMGDLAVNPKDPDHMDDISMTGAVRLEVMEQKGTTVPPSMDEPFTFTLVYWPGTVPEGGETNPASLLPPWAQAGAHFDGDDSPFGAVESVRKLRTVFPERSRWKPAQPTPAPDKSKDELGEIGRIALFVQLIVWDLGSEEDADAFKRTWPDLGYNALGEEKVYRCDLFASVDEPNVLVSRKVVRNIKALEAHEATEHYLRWEAERPKGATQREVLYYDTHYPRTSYAPFRTRWATV